MTVPLLIRIAPQCIGYKSRNFAYRWCILFFTFVCYVAYHLSRKPISVVKSVLHHKNCSTVPHDKTVNVTNPYWCDWAPFDTSSYKDLLGTLDLSYLIAYAVAMFISGHIADRTDLRLYLSGGMIMSGVFTIGFGLGYFYNIHSYAFYIIMQILGGVCQATGWPGVVACVGNWFGKGKRGLIMGIWNAHTSVGNILGSVIAGIYVESNWGLSFVVPGVIICVVGILVFLLLVPHPKDVNCELPDHSDHVRVKYVSRSTESLANGEQKIGNDSETTALIPSSNQEKPITILKALTIPGVIEFSLCLFFAKLNSYTFLYWLPNYIAEKTTVSASDAAYTSTIFDAGGILGGILAGYLSDRYKMRGLTCFIFLIIVAPMLFIYDQYGHTVPFYANCLMLALCGLGVNGPYALITTAVSADLGTHKSIRENSKALGMVTAIIDGTGSIGAAIGPMLTGVVSATGWDNVFYMLIAADFIAAFVLIRVVIKEIRHRLRGEMDTVVIVLPKMTRCRLVSLGLLCIFFLGFLLRGNV
ncbi:glucose-6-phosphate exchanger SLC37A2 [Biomphalaria pfeifferi]|uniref:Sugar phosphate exchanger 3 n=1 Tax=Biomphalaria pfeifferi TaxID=112525 RepID=A0AAD8F1H8_BIOPF|nr:glucose-6-phosphate exchanger SLC37A2 [Biomphalaria pfeifferi]